MLCVRGGHRLYGACAAGMLFYRTGVGTPADQRVAERCCGAGGACSVADRNDDALRRLSTIADRALFRVTGFGCNELSRNADVSWRGNSFPMDRRGKTCFT